MADKVTDPEGQNTDEGGQSTGNTDGDEIKLTQAELDRRIAQAIKTREDNLKSKFERERVAEKERLEEEQLKAESKYKELLELYEKKEQRSQVQNKLNKVLTKHQLDLDIDPDRVGDVDLLDEVLTIFNKKVDNLVEAELTKRLNTGNPPSTTHTGKQKSVSDLSPEEWKERRKEYGLS